MKTNYFVRNSKWDVSPSCILPSPLRRTSVKCTSSSPSAARFRPTARSMYSQPLAGKGAGPGNGALEFEVEMDAWLRPKLALHGRPGPVH